MANLTFLDRGASINFWLDQLPTPPTTPATSSRSTMATIGDGSDPWDWDIERVVQELCTTNRSWQPRSASMTISDPSSLEQALRHHEVSGNVLLEHIDDTVMKEDLGLRVLGRRAFVRSAITELRLLSAQYQAYQRTYHPEEVASSAISRSIHDFMRLFPDHNSSPGQSQQPLSSPREAASGNGVHLIKAPPPFSDQTAAGDQNVSVENMLIKETANKRRKLDFTGEGEEPEPQFDDGMQEDAEDQAHEPNAPPIPTIESGTVSVIEVNGKKRKRLAPTLITPAIDWDRNREIPSAADDLMHYVPKIVEAGVPFIGSDGRRRLVPIPVPRSGNGFEAHYASEDHVPKVDTADHASSSVEEALSHQSSNGRGKTKPLAAAESSSSGYLGKRKMPVDDLFYEGTAVGQELCLGDDTTVFAELPKKISAGRRLYVHGVMRNFLRAERQVFTRGGSLFSAIRPYSEKLTQRFQNPSFTLYYAKDGQIHARREEVPSWPEVDPSAIAQRYQDGIDENKVTFKSLGPEWFNSYDSLDPSTLEKYMYLEGGDVILPPYGFSDEENEYDPATWREIEEERGEVQRQLKRLKKEHISREEINNAIDEEIAEIVAKWNEKTRPKRENKAFRLWKMSRFLRTTHDQINRAQKDLDHILARLAKMRMEILHDVWSSKQQVRRQTRIMEVSIFAREDLRFRIATLEQHTAPEKPSHAPPVAASKKSTDPSNDSEDGESIGSESENVSSDDGMGDFVIPGEDLPTIEEVRHELNLADSEDEDGEDATMSDASISDISGDLTITPTRQICLEVSKTGKRSIENVDSDMEDYGLLSPPSANNTSTQSIKDEEPTLPKLPAASPNTAPLMVDLTMLSSDDSSARQIINLITPEKKKKPLIKWINRSGPFSSSPITVSDSNNDSFPVYQMPDPEKMPPYDNPAAIAKYSYTSWARSFDRERLLIKVFHGMDEASRASFFEFMPHVSEIDLWGNITQIIDALIVGDGQVQGMDSSVREIITGFIRLFVMYMDGRYHTDRKTPTTDKLKKVLENKSPYFTPFYKLCCQMESYFDHNKIIAPSTPNRPTSDDADDDDEDGEPLSAIRRRPRYIMYILRCQITFDNC
jgi:hypothetical protein